MINNDWEKVISEYCNQIAENYPNLFSSVHLKERTEYEIYGFNISEDKGGLGAGPIAGIVIAIIVVIIVIVVVVILVLRKKNRKDRSSTSVSSDK